MSDMAAESELEERRPGFSVELNERGVWVVRERCGLVEGEFATQGEAIRFALGELGRGRVLPAGFEPSELPMLASHGDDD